MFATLPKQKGYGQATGTPLQWMLLDIHKEGNPMAQSKDTTKLSGMLFQFMGMEDPMLSMLEWLCAQMMEAEVSNQIGAEKHEQSRERTSHQIGRASCRERV